MVSKTCAVLVLLALVAMCYSKSLNTKSRNQYAEKQQQDSNELNQSSQEQEPRDMQQQKNRKNLQVQDTSSSESDENRNLKKMRTVLSGEDDNQSIEVREGPAHQPMYQGRNGPEYNNGKQARVNIQKSRNGNDYESNESNNSNAEQNRMQRQHHY